MLEAHHIKTIQRMTKDELRTLVASGFDANYYLLENPDVVSAECPALDHYLEYGWLEGRRPSAHFAACASMFDLAELQAMGIDPFALFLLIRATSQPLVNGDSNAALVADPLASFRMQGHARYAATLAGHVDWTGVAVEPTHDSPHRASAARLRLAFRAYVGRPLVILPDRNWPGVLGIARAFDERHVAFLHFGDAASADAWRAVLSNVVGLPATLAEQGSAGTTPLLIDVVRGMSAPLVVDLGARAMRNALIHRDMLLAGKSLQVVTFVAQSDVSATIPDGDGITKVTLLSAAATVVPSGRADELAIDPSSFTNEQSRELVTKIFSHGI